MLFVEPIFIGFFAIVLVAHWAVRHAGARKVWLLLASYVFYAAWDWRFLSLVVGSTVLDYVVALALARPRTVRVRKLLLFASLAGNLGILGFFKYYNFFVASAVELGSVLGMPVSAGSLNIILPVGISFYTFQTLSYTIDVYRGKLVATRNILDLALFVAFFPQLVAGPIVRASDFLPQLKVPRVFRDVDVRACLMLFIVGYFKKACISDYVAPVVDTYFADPIAYSALSAWVASFTFAVQIYCDFSGYTDMAIACAGLLGYRLCTNFRFPYLATNVTEFWHRWHISLSTWLRDYLYVPLGGSRGGRWFTYRNLMLTMVLGGLWHGAAWNFIIWGGLHGMALIAHKEWRKRVPANGDSSLPGVFVRCLLTFLWVCIGWVFFRSPDTSTAFVILKSMVCLGDSGLPHLLPGILWVLPAVAIAHWLHYRRFFLDRLVTLGDGAFAACCTLAVSLILTIVPPYHRAFIYFQF